MMTSGDKKNIDMLGFPLKLSNDSADSAKCFFFLENPVGKVPPNIIFFGQRNKLTVWLCPTPHSAYLTPNSAYLSWGTDFHRFHFTGQKPLCDRCDINYDRCDINDKVNQINLYFETVSIHGWAVGLHDSNHFFGKYYEDDYLD